MIKAIGLDGQVVYEPEPLDGASMRAIMEDKAEMLVFDRLPRVVRDSLQTTVRKWDARDAVTALRQGMSPWALADFIQKMDADQARQENPYGRH